jgi:hypothetical protein
MLTLSELKKNFIILNKSYIVISYLFFWGGEFMHFVDYAIVVFYLVSVVVLGFYFQKKASKNIDAYFLGENGLPWWALGASGMVLILIFLAQ